MNRTILALSATVAALALAPSAQATTFVAIDLQPAGGVLSSTFGASEIDAGEFTHSYGFSLALPGDLLSSSLITFALEDIGLPGDVDFLKAYIDDYSVVANRFTLSGAGFGEVGGLVLTGISAGAHTIFVEGSAVGGGSYAGTLNIRAAVPEPATWAMMIAGFGLAGVALRRRSAAARNVAVSFV